MARNGAPWYGDHGAPLGATMRLSGALSICGARYRKLHIEHTYSHAGQSIIDCPRRPISQPEHGHQSPNVHTGPHSPERCRSLAMWA